MSQILIMNNIQCLQTCYFADNSEHYQEFTIQTLQILVDLAILLHNVKYRIESQTQVFLIGIQYPKKLISYAINIELGFHAFFRLYMLIQSRNKHKTQR